MRLRLFCLLLLTFFSAKVFSQTSPEAQYDSAIAASSSAPDPTTLRAKALTTLIEAYYNHIDGRVSELLSVKLHELMAIDFVAAGQGINTVNFPYEKRKEVIARLMGYEQDAINEYNTWKTENFLKQHSSDPSSLPYPRRLPALGKPLPSPSYTSYSNTLPSSATTHVPLTTEQECAGIIMMAGITGKNIPIGALVYKTEGRASCRSGFAIWGFDCAAKSFTAIGPNVNEKNCKSNDYTICKFGPYVMCPECGGNPKSSKTEYVKDDAWHQTNFNVYKSDPNAVKKVEIITICRRCKGEGVIRK